MTLDMHMKELAYLHRKEWLAEGEHIKAIETARNGLNLGLPLNQIQILTGLSMSEIQNLK